MEKMKEEMVNVELEKEVCDLLVWNDMFVF